MVLGDVWRSHVPQKQLIVERYNRLMTAIASKP
jgi:hypothetical protein